MSGGNDGGSKLKLSDTAGANTSGNVAFGVPSIVDEIAQSAQLAEYEKRIKQLERNINKLKKSLEQNEKPGSQAKSGSQGKARHIAHAEGWQAVCTAPDFCKVGKDVVAFNSFATLDQKRTASPNVKARGTPIYRKGDVLQNVQADAGKHVVSCTSLGSGHVKILDGHENVKVNGVPVARHDSRCLINCDASGVGGAKGKLVTEQKTAGAAPPPAESATPPGKRSSAKLEALKKAREAVAAGMTNIDALDEYVNFEQSNEVLGGLIKNISGAPCTGADYAAQVARGLLGFAKDAILGVGELAYEGIKAVPKLARLTQTESGRLHAGLDAQILAENIKLGNITAGSTGRKALAIGESIVAPITDPWQKGQYVESVTRGATEAGSIWLGWLKGTKVARAAKALDPPKGASTAGSVAGGSAARSAQKSPSVIGAGTGHADPGVHISGKSAVARKLSPLVLVDRGKITQLSNEAAGARQSAKSARALGDEDTATKFDKISEAKIKDARAVLRPFVNRGDLNAVLDRLDVSSPKDGAYFWSGWADGASQRAGNLANKVGGVTLESTPGGRVVDGWTEIAKSRHPGLSDEFWPGISDRYAAGASGKITIVQSESAWLKGGGDIWKQIELPQILKQGQVGEATFFDINGNVRQAVPLKEFMPLLVQ